MQTVRIASSPAGGTVAEDVPLPFVNIDPPLEASIFRRLAAGEQIRRTTAPLIPAHGLQAIRTTGPQTRYWNTVGRFLVFVISGRLQICATAGDARDLTPGDVLLIDTAKIADGVLRRFGDCRLLQIHLHYEWMAHGTLPQPALDRPGDPQRKPKLKRMYQARDDKSYFKAFDELFATANGDPGVAKPVRGFWFVRFEPGAFIDWHPEVVNNFVIVLSGALELEVSGDGAIEVFGPGDVCLAEDRRGAGHIDRMHGINRLALVEFEDHESWGHARGQRG